MNPLRQPPRRYDYVTDGQEIYRRSFGMIRDEADLSGLPADLHGAAVRIIHAAGDVGITSEIAGHPEVAAAALWLCAPGSEGVNGQTIAIDGGET